MVQWFTQFNNFQKNLFYVSGESYGGIYVPYLATAILNYNQNPYAGFQINLKGFIVGNGVTDYPADMFYGGPTFLYYHGLVSPQTWISYNQNGCINNPFTEDCENLSSDIEEVLTNVNIYDIYGECYNLESPNITEFNYLKFIKNAPEQYPVINFLINSYLLLR